MRFIFAILLVACSACQPSRESALEQAEWTQTEVLRQAKIKQSVQAFGGTVIGKDEGEWGGEVSFQEPDGASYRLVADNSHGIFHMPYGIVTLTGLSHLGINRGMVHLLSRAPGGRVTATPTLRLPGSPCDVVRTDRDISMRIVTGFSSMPSGRNEPVLECFSLESSTRLIKIECPRTAQSPVCFG
jgi:hypothetical protein